MNKIRVGIVNYLNTAPLIYGLKKSKMINEIELISDYPSNLADDLISNSIDVGLVPVATIPSLKQWWLIGNHCIGAVGAVASVCLFSEVPLTEIRKVLLDYQSRTSVELARILISEHWKIDVEMKNGEAGFEKEIQGSTAALVIGDRALRLRNSCRYKYDLAEAWHSFTGLPFVFAAWVSNKPMDENFIRAFDEANAYGVRNIEEVIRSLDSNLFDLQDYFTNYISYDLDDQKKKGLQKFLQYLDPTITLSR